MAIHSKAILILGASGDLAQRKLVPALAELYSQGKMASDCRVIGNGRSRFSNQEFRDFCKAQGEFRAALSYYQGMKGLKEYIQDLGNFDATIVFFALPPGVYTRRIEELYRAGFRENTRIIIEKPFGRDLKSARELNSHIDRFYHEDQVYRIDHYLAKEPAQNLMVFRFANAIFEHLWNAQSISSIQINASEELGVEKRAQYFDSAGVIRDMVQNHLLQLLCLTTMDPPVSLDAEDIRETKIRILRCLEVVRTQRMQYEGYREEEGVDPHSETETFVEMELRINNFRWADMPVYLRTGKGLHRKGTEIGITFKPLPNVLFNRDGALSPNQIVIKIQPNEGIILNLATKEPGGQVMQISNTTMQFCYHDSFPGKIPEAYQRLLMDSLRGDKTLFVNSRESELAWGVVEPILDRGDLHFYPRGNPPPSPLQIPWMDFDSFGPICKIR